MMRRPGHMQEMRNGYGVADRRRNSGLEIGLLTGDGAADRRWNRGGMDRGMRVDSAAPVFFYGKIAGI